MAQTEITIAAGQSFPLPEPATEANNGVALTTPDPDFANSTTYTLSDDTMGALGNTPHGVYGFTSSGKVGTVTITGTDAATTGSGSITGTLVVTVTGEPATDLIITPGAAS